MSALHFSDKTKAALDAIVNERMEYQSQYANTMHYFGVSGICIGALIIAICVTLLVLAVKAERRYGWYVTATIFGTLLLVSGIALVQNHPQETRKAIAFEVNSKFNHCVSGCYLWFHYYKDEANDYPGVQNMQFSLISTAHRGENSSTHYLASYFNSGNSLKIISLDKTGTHAYVQLNDKSVYTVNLYLLLLNARTHMSVSSYNDLNTVPKGSTRGFVNSQGL